MLREITTLDELHHNEVYCYHGKTDDEHTFTVKRHDKEENGGYETIQLNYKDGYVADVPVENIERHISEGKIYEV